MARNVALIYQPHFMSSCFRVAVDKQRGEDYNYIIVTCSPQFNGVWKYPVENTEKYKIWINNNKQCYCVPMDDCEFVYSLDKLDKKDYLIRAREQQETWWNGEIRNGKAHKKQEFPSWFISKDRIA